MAFEHDAIDRDLLAWPNAKLAAGCHLIERNILLAAVVAHDARGLGRQVEERADGARGLRAGLELQHLAEKHERGDDGRRLEIYPDLAVRPAEGLRKDPRQ